ncbi:O-antigen ligase family protein [Microbacterium hydrocarbonoxydans]|uniref:O-antigen ligase family protein n=1 Tax=Microbacterium hydrocarbonoxydans TaxID=273678 RepID=UPI0013DA3D7E|nr:O-antigen ligase family protein [Microbacterium hydrocarbonoxydans]
MGTNTRQSRGSAAVPSWLRDLWGDAWRWVLFAGGVAAGGYLLLDRGVANGIVTAAAIGALLVGAVLSSSKPMAIALMATPALFVVERVGLGGGDLTASDVALAAAFGSAVLLGDRDLSPPLKALLRLNLIYQFTTLFTVIVNPFTQNLIEWFHAWLLISGALLGGWAIGRAGKARFALILVYAVATLIALGTLTGAALMIPSGEIEAVYPQWPWSMHKNFAGGALAFAAFVAYVNPDWAQIPKRWARSALVLFLVALLLTQSRQAMVGFLVALLVHVVRQGAARHWVLITAIAVPGVVLIVQSVIEQIESQNRFNSVYQRLEWMGEVYALWKHSPIFGHGLRYWYVHPTANFQPPQAELEVIASAGIVGLLGFIAMWLGILIVLWRVDRRFGMLALGLVLARIVQAQFDLFWVSAQVSIPFFIAGICLGAQALAVTAGDAGGFWNEKHHRASRRSRALPARAARRRERARDQLVTAGPEARA